MKNNETEEVNISSFNTELKEFSENQDIMPTLSTAIALLFNKPSVRQRIQETFELDDEHYNKMLGELKQEIVRNNSVNNILDTGTGMAEVIEEKPELAEKKQIYFDQLFLHTSGHLNDFVESIEQSKRISSTDTPASVTWLDLLEKIAKTMGDKNLDSKVLEEMDINLHKVFPSFKNTQEESKEEFADLLRGAFTDAIDNAVQKYPGLRDLLEGEKPSHVKRVAGFAGAPNIRSK